MREMSYNLSKENSQQPKDIRGGEKKGYEKKVYLQFCPWLWHSRCFLPLRSALKLKLRKHLLTLTI